MQPIDHLRRRAPHPAPQIPNAGELSLAGTFEQPPAFAFDAASLRIAAPALLVEARFGELTLASRLLRADAPGVFTIGAGRGADAPVNPAWLGAQGAPEPAPYPLVTVEGGVFVLGLAPAMRAELRTPVQRLVVGPDLGRAEAPLALPPDSQLVVPCGEVTFEIRASELAPALPRPWLPARWREEARYPLGVVLAMLLLVGIVRAVPADPRALSLDDIAASHRWDRTVTIPLDVSAPQIETALAPKAPGGGGAPAAAKPMGKAGDKKAPDADARLAIKGHARPEDARAAATRVRSNGLLLALGAKTGALADVLSNESALGSDAADVLGHLAGTTIAAAYGAGGLNALGTGEGGGGTHEGLLGTGGLGTRGRYGSGPGTGPGIGPGADPGYGQTAGQLRRYVSHTPDVLPGVSSVRGSLDKEIIRRIVRRHLNEVRYCYDQGLTTRPSLSGRVVVQFTIAPTGRVIASLIGSSTLGAVSVEACLAAAVRRWEFPAPEGGGLVMVSYPFQLSPAGG